MSDGFNHYNAQEWGYSKGHVRSNADRGRQLVSNRGKWVKWFGCNSGKCPRKNAGTCDYGGNHANGICSWQVEKVLALEDIFKSQDRYKYLMHESLTSSSLFVSFWEEMIKKNPEWVENLDDKGLAILDRLTKENVKMFEMAARMEDHKLKKEGLSIERATLSPSQLQDMMREGRELKKVDADLVADVSQSSDEDCREEGGDGGD